MPRTILLCALMLSGNAAPARSLEELERALARTPPVSTAFVEFRFSHQLKRPLSSRGTLEYRADGVMVRNVDAPRREVSEVDGEKLRITRGDQPARSIPLDRAPQLRVLLASFRALLEGRFAPLEKDFELTFEEHPESWALTLAPRDARLAKQLARIEVIGAGDQPACIAALEPDGDGTLTLLGAAPAVPPDATRADLERLCRSPAMPAPSQ